ncbi:MAG: tetratricopeptide repeat protein [Candidatus Saganbacteria bacterium]|uniref:Tetratricopeptide repeat protein n=1 Tax=Candidatus Saganbacteria bacterium TaxID=2575572 RepID=A0A833KZU2_UNCSA|nr:MAG: tetratricopeptide repeat protein [Candidatus Saganbacteria bacterium]
MRRALIILVLFICSSCVFALPFENDITKGNRFYNKGEYDKAGETYLKKLESRKNDIALFNYGDALYKQGKFAESEKVFNTLTQEARDEKLKEKAFYNQGNAQFRQENYQGAVDSYSNALKIDPNDKDAAYNLALAKKQRPKQKQGQDKRETLPAGRQEKQKQEKSKKGMSKEDAERILQGISSDEKHKGKKVKGKGAGNGPDW